MKRICSFLMVPLMGATLALAAPPAVATEALGQPQTLLCRVSVQRLQQLWDATGNWAASQQEAGDALADAMAQSLADGDAELLALQTENAGYYLDNVRTFRNEGMKDDLREIAHLGSVITSAAPGHRSFVMSRIAKIRSLYKDYWYDLFAPTYTKGYQELKARNVAVWSALTDPLPDEAATAGQMFAKSFRGLPKVC